MGAKGRKDKDKRQDQKNNKQSTLKEKRMQKKENKNGFCKSELMNQ